MLGLSLRVDAVTRTSICLDCGEPFVGSGTRCGAHRSRLGGFSTKGSGIHQKSKWKRLSREMRKEHVATQGLVCPGWRVPAHAVLSFASLSVDHVRRPSRGGAPYDRRNLRVLCVDCNAKRGLAGVG